MDKLTQRIMDIEAKKKNKEKVKIDGKEYDLDDFDDSKYWTKVKK